MKGLLKHISPLAPDDSGACSVLYELGGIVVICDAGGCAGNVCGFDEPRWHEKRSALFSAGLRDMDAILGRDDKLVEKLVKAAEQVGGEFKGFTAIVGTPVPAVIATDFHALERMSERKTKLPCIAVDTDGTKLYDIGEQKAYMKLFERFAEDGHEVKPGLTGVLGATPLDTGLTRAEKITAGLDGSCICFGMDSGLEAIRRAGECEKLFVISPAGIKPAEYLNRRFGTPFEVGYPKGCLPEKVCQAAKELNGKRVLIVHQQFAANALRELISGCGMSNVHSVDCATWFMFDKRFARENDFRITDESVFAEKIEEHGYDVIIADSDLKRAVKSFEGEFIDFPHYAVSARLN